MKIGLYDPYGINPYSLELSRILSADNQVTMLRPRGAPDYGPPTAQRRDVLGSNARKQGYLRHAVSRLIAPLRLVRLAFESDVLVIVWTRDVLDTLCAISIASFRSRRVVFIHHNPIAARRRRGLHGWLEHLLERSAGTVVVHDKNLSKYCPGAKKVAVAAHPSYIGWAEAYLSDKPESDILRLLFIGAVRQDKGADHLVQLSRTLNSRETLTIAGSIAADTRRQLPHTVLVLTQDGGPVEDGVLANALSNCDVVVAPYTQVTQSGSVILALSCGREVVAYRSSAFTSLAPPIIMTDPNPTSMLSSIRERNSQPLLRREAPLWLDRECADDWKEVLNYS